MEGMICPECLKEFSTQQKLMAHFETAHSSNSGSSWRGLMNKAVEVAKSKLGTGTEMDEEDVLETERIKNIKYEWDPQEDGVGRRHTLDFRALRRERTNRKDLEQNQRLLRLKKLLYDGPSTSGLGKSAITKARKEFEKTVVSWSEDALVPSCPECGNQFGLMRRRHHCRLCGHVLCNDCSRGLEAHTGVNLIDAANSATNVLNQPGSGNLNKSVPVKKTENRGR